MPDFQFKVIRIATGLELAAADLEVDLDLVAAFGRLVVRCRFRDRCQMDRGDGSWRFAFCSPCSDVAAA
jgi:hypothetical protein